MNNVFNFNKDTLLVGQILKPIGIKGAVKIRSFMSLPADFIKLSDFQLDNGENVKFSGIKHIEYDKFSGIICGITDRDVLDKYRLKNLYIDRKLLSPLETGEYYFDDLQGLNVFDKQGTLLGKVCIALDYGAGVFLELSIIDNKIGTIPFNKDAIIDVNLHELKIVIDPNYILA